MPCFKIHIIYSCLTYSFSLTRKIYEFLDMIKRKEEKLDHQTCNNFPMNLLYLKQCVEE